ncbi:ATP-dependent RNA helicase HrpA [Quadrisphaera sp. DSM 44207]|uniref:ATP-dependent RNA helicase HrpA n=1 Tax=Quadrisphaera sp. DSM 44207 TaxID=1881057 RepID=UPI0008841DD9|nr:ATP-dependent RNA helicase HrpA [Quadrisphaera sp. DSM 44207]SDQ37440.1 ATP-dependent helicase HrpA [Quadrisphaera sp. DSM 44207]
MDTASAVDLAPPLDARALVQRLEGVMLRDEQRLRRRLDALHRTRDPRERERALASVAAAVAASEEQVARRRASVPAIRYPEQLPVSQRRDGLAAAIRDHQVVVVAGETGSGKTTQLPKICLELGRGVRGMVGHTQPRRIAARSVAERVAEELGTRVGGAVGYAVRFTDEVGPDSLVKLMTDGILLAEVQRDRDLRAYDTIVVDEAHERSLTIDFLLGYLHRLLPRRPDLKLVVTSATIEPARFAEHFAAVAGEVPVVEVSGRTYPVQVRYRPLVEEVPTAATASSGSSDADDDADDDAEDPDHDRPATTVVRDQVEAVVDAVQELAAEGPGDVLVFLSGEREIRDTADALGGAALRGTEVLPLYGRLSAAEQHRVFAPHTGRRVVLSTNVAETSLTVPGIRYVVDAGTARTSRYSLRTKVQRLPIEPISQASADQRAGRCGRVAEGVAIRLYSEEDYLSRPRYTEPEVQRTNLASVILQMTSLGLGEVESFPFLDPPDRRQVRDGVALLHELGALDPARTDPRERLTETGRRIAQIPLDPRLARMLLAADGLGVLPEVLVVVAAMSVQDVRERPADAQEAAAASHRRFAVEGSDFLGHVALWDHLRTQQRELSSSAFRRACRAEFLHFLRIREWQDLHAQLRRVTKTLGLGTGTSGGAPVRTGEELEAVRDAVHQALLAGLLSHVGLKDTASTSRPQEFLGARGARFALSPGSVLAKRPPAWVVAGELVETSRLWARTTARIDPLWVEQLAGHLVKRQHSEPRWERKRGAVVATERVTLYGLPVVTGRTVGYGRIDPQLSRELFIRRALVEGDWTSHHRFLARNRELLEEVEELQARTRRRDLLVDDETLFAFYDARVPQDVVSARHFDAWWKAERRRRPDLLVFDPAALVRDEAAPVAEEDFPLHWREGDLVLDLTYRFEPGAPDDGVSVHVPLAVLNQVSSAGLDWQVPGFRLELVTALLRGLPKPLRVQLVPVPDTARALLAALPRTPPRQPLVEALGELLRARRGVVVPREAWSPDAVPAHLRPTFAIEDERGRVVASGKDLEGLRARLRGQTRSAVSRAVARAGDALERTGLTRWPDVDPIPQTVERVGPDGRPVVGHPALVVEDGGTSSTGGRAAVALRVLATPAEQVAAHPAGVRALVRAALPSPARAVLDGLSNADKLALATAPGGVEALLDDVAAAAVDALVAEHSGSGGGDVRTRAAFDAVVAAVRPRLVPTAAQALGVVRRVLATAADVRRRLEGTADLALLPSLTDARAQLDGLVHPGFVAETGLQRLPDLLRYLHGISRRLDALPRDRVRDRDRTGVVQRMTQEHERTLAALPPARRSGEDVRAVRWMLEELRISLFAQTLGTPSPVSEKRILAALRALRG